MEDKLYNIVNMLSDKYGKSHKFTILAAKIISPHLLEKRAEAEQILNTSFDINIDELISLIKPERYNFERQTIDTIEVEK